MLMIAGHVYGVRGSVQSIHALWIALFLSCFAMSMICRDVVCMHVCMCLCVCAVCVCAWCVWMCVCWCVCVAECARPAWQCMAMQGCVCGIHICIYVYIWILMYIWVYECIQMYI